MSASTWHQWPSPTASACNQDANNRPVTFDLERNANLCNYHNMRLRIATAFALLLFLALGITLFQVSDRLPEETAGQAAPFAFDPGSIDGSAAYQILGEFLKISPRDSGTDQAKTAALFIKSALENTGLTAEIDEFLDYTPKGQTVFRNITATAPGNSNSCIVLLSHYDTKSGLGSNFTGANDSGSSTALLIHMASAMGTTTASIPDIVFAFVDGEECMENYSNSDGLHGSTRLAETLPARYGVEGIKAVIVLDMIGDKDLTVTVPRNSYPELIQRVFKEAEKEGARNRFSLYGPILDDHEPFRRIGVPAIDIIDFYYGSSPRQNDYWHTENDSIDKVAPESLELIGRITVRLVNSLIANPLDRLD